jgi:hypothetical protein
MAPWARQRCDSQDIVAAGPWPAEILSAQWPSHWRTHCRSAFRARIFPASHRTASASCHSPRCRRSCSPSRRGDRVEMQFAAVHESGCGRYCCKSILSISSRHIDSRSGTNAQQRFKRAPLRIRLLQNSISQSPLGDFCNTIGPSRHLAQCSDVSGFGAKPEVTGTCSKRRF